MGMLELQQNDLPKAEEYLRKSLDVTENIRRISTSNDLTAAFSARIHERYEGYIECIMRQSRMRASTDLAIRAFEISELARARSLADFLRGTQTNLTHDIEPELAEKERSLRQELRVKEDSKVSLLATNYKRTDLDALTYAIASLEVEYRKVAEKIRTQDPAYDQITTPRAWDLQRIRDEVIADDDTVLLEFSLGTERSYVWVITQRAFSTYELPSARDINAAATRSYDALRDPQPKGEELHSALQTVSQMLLSPVSQKLPKRIIVVADGVLHYLPFQVLSAPSEAGLPLVDHHVIVNAPSVSILGQLQQELAHRAAPPNVLAAFGDPVFQSNFRGTKDAAASAQSAPTTSEAERSSSALRDIEVSGDSVDPSRIQPLFYAKRELANLQEIAGAKTLIATGFEASRERLEAADLRKYAILHFATHGILDPKRPENSGIFLSTIQRDGRPQNGYVSLEDIYGLRAPVDLVVLSACQTGLGKEVRGEGLIGLTRGFMYAGAASVVASLWRVDDEATAELMKRFYTNMLQRGIPPAEALRAAQNSIRSEPQWSSPYYWAAFTLQGEYRNPISLDGGRQNLPQALIVAIGLAAMGVVLLLSYRRMRAGLPGITPV
jgi:CHAT domain-containing protein